MAKYYLDACIWRDYYENRSDQFRPLGEWALMLINKILEQHETIVVSDFILFELGKVYKPDVLDKIFSIASESRLLLEVNYTVTQVRKAIQVGRKRKIPPGDELHAILARDNNAILITRDKHFEELRNIVEIRRPEELI